MAMDKVKFYLAASAGDHGDRYLAEQVIDRLVKDHGWECTYNWPARWLLEGSMEQVCALEKMGVKYAQVLVALIPGRRGTYWEMGLADAWGVSMIVVDVSRLEDPPEAGPHVAGLPFLHQDKVKLVHRSEWQPHLEEGAAVEDWAVQIAWEAVLAWDVHGEQWDINGLL